MLDSDLCTYVCKSIVSKETSHYSDDVQGKLYLYFKLQNRFTPTARYVKQTNVTTARDAQTFQKILGN